MGERNARIVLSLTSTGPGIWSFTWAIIACEIFHKRRALARFKFHLPPFKTSRNFNFLNKFASAFSKLNIIKTVILSQPARNQALATEKWGEKTLKRAITREKPAACTDISGARLPVGRETRGRT